MRSGSNRQLNTRSTQVIDDKINMEETAEDVAFRNRWLEHMSLLDDGKRYLKFPRKFYTSKILTKLEKKIGKNLESL